MIKAVRLHGAHMSSFMGIPGGKIMDLSGPIAISNQIINWHDLQNKRIYNTNIILTRYGDIHPFYDGPVFTCKNLFLDHCDKNFIYYWLNRRTFPNVQNVYLGSHPCKPNVLRRDFAQIHLHEAYRNYKKKWAHENNNIQIITEEKYDEMIQYYENEELKFNESCDNEEPIFKELNE
jgi:hypothetical protein